MFDLVERHFDILRSEVDGAGGEVFTTHGRRCRRRLRLRRGRGAARPSRHSDSCGGSGSTCAWACTRVRSERVGDDYRGRPVNRAARHHGGRPRRSDPALRSDRRRSCAPGPGRSSSSTSACTGCGTSPSPSGCGRWPHPDLPDRFPPVRGIQHGLDEPARASGPPWSGATSRSHLTSTVLDAAPPGDRSRAWVGSARPASRCTPPQSSLLGSTACGSSRWPACPTPTTSPTRSRVTVGRDGRRPIRSSPRSPPSVTGERTLLVVDNCEHVVDRRRPSIDELTERVPRPVRPRHQSRAARHRR